MSSGKCSAFLLVCCLVAAWATGCQLGPAALRIGHARYNDAIRTTTSEELLLNLVRLKYREAPVFLEIGTVSAQFVFDQSADTTGTFTEDVGAQRGNPMAFEFGAGVGYSERPTITYAPLAGEDFVQRLLSPIDVETLVLLAHSGWRVDRIVRMIVQSINGLDNAGMASGPTPSIAPTYQEFVQAAKLLTVAQRSKRLLLEYENRSTEISDPIPASMMTAEALVKSAEAGARFRATSDGEAFVLTRETQKLILRFAQVGEKSAAMAKLRSLLDLEPSEMEFDLVTARTTRGGARNDAGKRTQVAVNMRSLLGAMFFLSQGIETPKAHAEANLVTTTLNADGSPFDWQQVVGDLMMVHAKRTYPRHAAVAVQHRGYWFYIKDDDLNSKSTFALLGQIFALRAGAAKGVAPTLTLNVGG